MRRALCAAHQRPCHAESIKLTRLEVSLSVRLSASQLSLISLLLIAAALRLQNLGAIEHNVDHAYPIWQALSTLEQGSLPLVGQGTSVLFANPALTGYLYIPALLVVRSPYAPYLFVIALNTLAVWFAYRALRRLWDEPAALIGAFLLAVNPWVVEYSRTTWVQALLPFFACLTFWLFTAVWLGQAQRPQQRFWLGCLALAAMTQTYLLAFAALIPVGLLSLIFRRRVGWRALWIGALLILMPTAIYGVGLLSDSAQTFRRLQGFTQGRAALSPEAFSHALRLMTGRDYAAARGLEAPIQDALLRFQLSEVAHWLLIVALLGGVVIMLRRKRSAAVIVLIWGGLPPLMMSYVSQAVHPFYLLLTLPALHLLAGVGLAAAARQIRWQSVRWAALALCLAAFGVLCALNVLRYAQESLSTPSIDGLTALPLAEGVPMAQQLLSAEKIGEAVVFANSFAGRLFAVDRDVNISETRYHPQGGGVYLLFGAADRTQPVPSVSDERERYTFADGGIVEAFFVQSAASIPRTMLLSSDKGITLIGAEIRGALRAGQIATLQLTFRVDALLPDRADWLFTPFAHVYDADNRRILIADGAVTPGWAWRLGDVQQKWVRLRLPAAAKGTLRVEIGLYDGVRGESALFELPDGRQVPSVPLSAAD
ncbi:glycosyltransferase family 39 protein [Chloroflexi bacterium CFX3]|nr:glycosyltransferase family 39 protein [Chloroflexi bacterium CFX3]